MPTKAPRKSKPYAFRWTLQPHAPYMGLLDQWIAERGESMSVSDALTDILIGLMDHWNGQPLAPAQQSTVGLNAAELKAQLFSELRDELKTWLGGQLSDAGRMSQLNAVSKRMQETASDVPDDILDNILEDFGGR